MTLSVNLSAAEQWDVGVVCTDGGLVAGTPAARTKELG